MCVRPRKAATVAVLRDNSGQLEVLLMKRHGDDRFLPDYYVFPGGAHDVQDSDFKFPEKRKINKLKDFDGNLNKYYGYIMCGIRETFEESGILLALDGNNGYPAINTEETVAKFSKYRELVFEQKLSFKEMLLRENLTPAVDNFYYISRWITPPLFPIRYDTRFFAAVVPENQETSHDGNELIDFEWMQPGDALTRYRDNRIKLVMPTIKTLELLSRFKKAGDVISSLRDGE